MYQCDICDKFFANKSNLNRHNLSKHQMEEDYQSSSSGEEEIDKTYDSDEDEDIQEAVSYTHLTLPTILLV